ncbi:MAG: hypothetical protein ACP5XB_16755 [Isosphaeraceae bacterium]
MGSALREFARRRSRPVLDTLEGRVVLTTFHAYNLAQLAADVAAVNNTTGPNTILLRGGNYVLTQSLKIQNAGNLTIRSSTVGGVVNLTGSAVDRVLEIDGGSVTLQGLSISGGSGVPIGGGILAQNTALTLRNVRLYTNAVSQAGGGIFAEGGALNIYNSQVMNNRASNSIQAMGGGIVAWNTATTIASSIINENSVFAVDTTTTGGSVSGTGGGIYAQGGTLNIRRSTVTGNTVYAVTTGNYGASSGGGVSSYGTPVTVTGSTFQYNSLNTVSNGGFAIQGSVFSTAGGSLSVADSTISRNTPAGLLHTFYHPGTTVTISNSTIDTQRITGTRTL